MRKKLPYLLPSLVFFLGAPVIWLLCFREVPLVVAPETTRITSPLTPEGKIDWFAAIKERFEPKINPKENGFRRIVEALGKSPYFDEPDWYWPELCRALDLDPNLTPTSRFEPADEFLRREFLLWMDGNEEPAQKIVDELNAKFPDASASRDTEKLIKRLQTEPWTFDEFPFMRRWIEENTPFLDLVAEAVRNEHYFEPKLRNPNEKPKSLDSYTVRGARQLELSIPAGFEYRMQYYLGTKSTDKAWDDAVSISCLRIHNNYFFPTANHFTAHARLVLERVKNGSGVAYTEKAATDGSGKLRIHFENAQKNFPVSDKQRTRFLSDLDRLPKRCDVKDQIERWRYSEIRNTQIYQETGFNKPVLRLNWNVVARWCNQAADDFKQTADKLIAEPDESKREQIVDDFKSRYATPPKRSRLGRWLGKPITVRERSLEYVWANEQFYILNYHIPSFLLRREENDLREFRKELENGKTEP